MKHGTFRLALIAAIFIHSLAYAGNSILLKTGKIDSAQFNSATVFANQAEATDLYIVQWKSVVTESEKQKLRNQGIQFVDYVPEDAFIVKANGADMAAVAAESFVQAVVPYGAGMKVEPELAPFGVLSFNDTQMISVQFVQGSDAESVLRKYSDDFRKMADAVYVANVPVADAFELAKENEVVWVERFIGIQQMNITYDELVGGTTNAMFETSTGFESGARVMDMAMAYDRGYTGRGNVVGYGDTGMDKGDENDLHADFQGQIRGMFAVATFGGTKADPHSHGTHVAGSIAGNGADSNGLVRGAGYGAQLVAQGMWSTVFNNILVPNLTNMFTQAYQNGARVHSNSWGAPRSNGRYDNMSKLVDEFAFANPTFLPVFAAGNDGADNNRDGVIDEGTVSSPGTAKNALTVGASKNYLLQGGIQRPMSQLRNGTSKWGVEPIASSRLSEDARGMAAFSSRGPTQDRRIKPDVVAPGTNIVAARSRHESAGTGWGTFGTSYLYMGGTSMATPLTSGAAAVVREFLQQQTGRTEVSAALLKATLVNSAFDLFPGQFGLRDQGQEQPTTRPNNHQGFGMVTMRSLMNGTVNYAFHDETAGLATNESREYQVQARAGAPLRVTMVYTDAAGSAGAQRTLVNDLDMEIRDPNGTVVYANHGRSADRVNNVETIDIEGAAAGVYSVTVRGHNVPRGQNGRQPYALVIAN